MRNAYTANQNGVQLFPHVLEKFVQHQENKNTLSKTERDVSLLKKFLVSRNEPRELENIDARELDVLIANFLLQV